MPHFEKPVIATLILKASGLAPQFITVDGGKLAFYYERGVGHVRRYTDAEEFHREEKALRAIPRLPLTIFTRLGEPCPQAAADGALEEILADRRCHQTSKARWLRAVVDKCSAELLRIESAAPPRCDVDGPPNPPPLTERERMELDRRHELYRMAAQSGELTVWEVAKMHRLSVPLLNNIDGVIEAILAAEFPEAPSTGSGPAASRGSGPSGAAGNEAPVAEKALGKSDGRKARGKGVVVVDGMDSIDVMDRMDDLDAMPIEQLRALAHQRGVEGVSRRKLIAGLRGTEALI